MPEDSPTALEVRGGDVRFWPIADVRSYESRSADVMSASDPKGTGTFDLFVGTGSELLEPYFARGRCGD